MANEGTSTPRDVGPSSMLDLASVANELTGRGASAVILAGSHARGDANGESDVDLYALGVGPAYRLERRAELLISISYRTPEQVRASFLDPRQVGSAVPGWREAILLSDPQGIAHQLKQEADRWTWDLIPSQLLGTTVAEGITGFAEEVHKLVVSLGQGNMWTAAIQRSLLAVRLSPIMAIHLRLLYGTENRLWNLVADRLGEPWRHVQAAALGVGYVSFTTTCQAALELYSLAATEVWESLNADQRAVVAHACILAGYPVVT